MSRHTITSITIHPIRLAMIQVIMSVLAFITATMQYISTCTIIFKIFVVCSLKWKLYFTMTNATCMRLKSLLVLYTLIIIDSPFV